MDWDKVWTGKIWTAEQSVQPSGIIFEKITRSPGVRIMFIKEGMVLLSQEKRRELNGKIDHRLPGGKVFDKNEAYRDFIASKENILDKARYAAVKEALEEVGMIVEPTAFTFVSTDVLGATCSWDLIYFVCEIFEENNGGAQFHDTEAEEIQGHEWYTLIDACRLAFDRDQFSESRSAMALISYAASKGVIGI